MSETTYAAPSRIKYILVAVAVALAFFAAYTIAPGGAGATARATVRTASEDPAALASTCGGDCCGAGSSEPIEGSATVEGDVQKVSVDVTGGGFDPNTIRVKAGVPLEITFNEGAGCMAEVLFKDFEVFESLFSGGAVIDLPALDAGEYTFSCGMEMVFGTIIAE